MADGREVYACPKFISLKERPGQPGANQDQIEDMCNFLNSTHAHNVALLLRYGNFHFAVPSPELDEICTNIPELYVVFGTLNSEPSILNRPLGNQ